MITVIIPLRLSVDRLYDEVERLERIATALPSELYQVLIVDFGTPAERQAEIAELAARHNNVAVHRVNAEGLFSIGHARDIGVQQATSPVVMFHDLDFLCARETYIRIHEYASSLGLPTSGYAYFCVPTIFLNDAGSRAYRLLYGGEHPPLADQSAHLWALRGEHAMFEHFTTGSSALVIGRYAYLVAGGHDRAFVGHGAEDFELYHRLARMTPRAEKPGRYYDDIKDRSVGYQGFRSHFALFGLEPWLMGICMVHLHHPRRELTDTAYKRAKGNFLLLKSRMMEVDRTGRGLMPLTDPHSKERTLLLVTPNTMPARALTQALPALGHYEVIPETAFVDGDSLVNFARDRFTQILFLNPYGNDHRLALYDSARSAGLRTIAFDRGALPDSWFFDRDGFLGTSGSYAPSRWNNSLPPDRQDRVRSWIQHFREGSKTLEENETPQGVEYWRNALGIGQREVVLVALQRPHDVATRCFAGPVGSADGFVEWLRFLAAQIDQRRFVIVAKKHPLERDRPEIDGVIFPRDSANINDLIDLSSVVVTINSGVGLIALVRGRPVITCGDAFYQHDGLAVAAHSRDELVALTHSAPAVDMVAVERFVSYLTEDFYSFGSAHYANREEADGAVLRIAYRIDFSRIANLTAEPIDLGTVPAKLSEKSFLLEAAGYRKSMSTKAAGPAKLNGRQVPSWGPVRRTAHRTIQIAMWPILSPANRIRLAEDPIDYLSKARHPFNRLVGRILLNKSERPY